MTKMIFVNLHVADLGRSIDFYKAIGAEQNMQFSDESAAMMVLSETIHVMLLTHDKYRQFTSKRIADAHETSEVMLCVSEESREAVHAITNKALAAGGRETRAAEDHGFMYGRSFEDPDGHVWEPMWMDAEAASRAMAQQPQAATA